MNVYALHWYVLPIRTGFVFIKTCQPRLGKNSNKKSEEHEDRHGSDLIFIINR